MSDEQVNPIVETPQDANPAPYNASLAIDGVNLHGDQPEHKDPKSDDEVFNNFKDYKSVQGMNLGDRTNFNGTVNILVGSQTQESVDRILNNPMLDVQLVDLTTAERVRNVFDVSATYYKDAEGKFTTGNVVILVGSEGVGKQTTALALAQKYFDHQAIYRIDSTSHFDKLTTLNIDKACIILDGASKELLLQFNDFRLQGLCDRLRRKKCQLVITTTWQEAPTNAAIAPLLVRVSRSSIDAGAVIERHLKYWTSNDKTSATYDKALASYNDPRVQAIMGDIQSNRELHDLAHGLYRVALGEWTIESVTDHFQKLPDGEREAWLSQFNVPREWAFLLSMACFSGSRRDYIERMTEILISLAPEIFDPPRKPDDPPPPLMPIGDLYRRARVQRDYTETHETLIFNKSNYAYEVLDYFWKEYPVMQEAICDWLLAIGKREVLTSKTSSDIFKKSRADFDRLYGMLAIFEKLSLLRFRAAAAVGELARRNFAQIEELVLKYWIQTGDIHSQQLVGYAIAKPALGDEKLLPIVMRQLSAWATPDENDNYAYDGRYRRAATLAYGIIGYKQPTEALRNLHEIIFYASKTKNPFAVYESVIYALRLIFSYGTETPDFYAWVLQALAIWSHEEGSKSPVVRQSLLAFVVISAFDETEKDGYAWRTILLQAHRSSSLRGIIGGLMRRAINNQEIRSIAMGVLEIWIKHAQEIPKSRRVVYELLKIIYTNGHHTEQQRLIYFLKKHCNGRERNDFACMAQQELTGQQ